MEPEPPENRKPHPWSDTVTDLMRKYGVTPGTMDHVTLGPVFVEPRRRVVRLPPQPPVPAAGHRQRRVAPSPLEAALLDTLHRHHLQALATTGRDMLARHARGMLLAGYAYGLHDPVCNIVANCVFYDAVFPASSSQQVQPQFMSCKAIFRLARRSLDALVAFMAAYAPSLTAEQAVSYLSRTNGNLHHAAMLVDREGVNHADNMVDAFRAAVLAAHLPSDAAREAQFWFMVNCAPTDAFLARHGIAGHPLAFGLSELGSRSNASAVVLDFVKSALSGIARPQPVPPTPSSSSLSRGAYRALRLKIHGFKMDREFCRNVANVAIEKLCSQFGEPYQIHLLCGQSLLTLHSGSYYHVNFLASRDGGPNQLFFAEVRASLKGLDDVTLCCPVALSGKTGGCSACEYMGLKLIHPVDHEFNGQRDVTKGDDPQMVEFFRKGPTSWFDVPLIDDYVFFESDQHPEVTTFLETTYASMSDDQVDLSFLWFENYLP